MIILLNTIYGLERICFDIALFLSLWPSVQSVMIKVYPSFSKYVSAGTLVIIVLQSVIGQATAKAKLHI